MLEGSCNLEIQGQNKQLIQFINHLQNYLPGSSGKNSN